ncbi:hypothetical protein [Nocardioides sp. CFH 31398]|uniref:hypothetical protein n=1 Tax=Nocardioides sp. CFH 31398 TaxID=2919579 RepID=UPI001F0711AC|nr:hypothetical protein [Nocardioides sp. CFH 31398]MCH1866866.1 hypothetical protein [Nocardioides sp. CFH 31398]
MRALDPPPPLTPLDPFDLPEWLGTEAVTWRAEDSVRAGHLVRGRIGPAQDGVEGASARRFGGNGDAAGLPHDRFGRNGDPGDPGDPGAEGEGAGEVGLACDLLAVDDAHPRVVADEDVRRAAHMAWRHGQVHLVQREGRATLACPGSAFTADGVLDAVERMARAVGADPRRWEVRLLLGGRH